MNKCIHDVVAATLAELGLPVPGDFFQTMLLRDGHFDGWKLRYDGGYAVLQANSSTIELFDENGRSLKTIAAKAEKDEAA